LKKSIDEINLAIHIEDNNISSISNQSGEIPKARLNINEFCNGRKAERREDDDARHIQNF